VTPDELKAVILDFEKYADFLPEVERVEVHEQSDEAAKVTFHVHIAFAGIDVRTEYTVRYAIHGESIRWELESSPSLTKNTGGWKLEETDDGETRAHYDAEIETNLSIAPDVQALFIEEGLPKLMERFRDQAEEL
jgi:ribosome-associated toxin RatA of RatAB toxin-antitoxin module